MNTIKQILAVIDPTVDSQHGLSRSIDLAKKSGASITAFMSIYDFSYEMTTMLSSDEREAMSEYQQYLNNVYNEMIRASLISINDVDATLEQLQMIRPESHRVQTISELVLHIQRISLLGDQGK